MTKKMDWEKKSGRIPHIGKFTKVPLNLLFTNGICVKRWLPNEKPKGCQVFFTVLLVMLYSINISSMLAYRLFVPLENSLEKSAYIIYTTFAANAFIKLFSISLNLNTLRKVLSNFEEFYPKTVREREAYKLDQHLKSIRRYNTGLTIYHFCVTTMFNLFPLLQCIVLYYQSEQSVFHYELPFPMRYPFGINNTLSYAIAYALQCAGSYSSSCSFLGSDLLLMTCVHLINMNFKYLAKSVREFKPSGSPSDFNQLKQFITHHQHILTTAKLVDDTFNISIFLNFISTAAIICLIGFQLLVGTDFLDLIKFVSFFISVLIHVYFISIFGTEMMSLSSDISEAFMHHCWYEAHVSYQAAITLLIARAQKPAHLNAFKFFVVSMETFKSLMSVSYQFFTLVKTSYEEK